MTPHIKTSMFHGSTWYLLFCCFVFAWGDVLFGIDTGSFGSIQALPSWLREFGERHPDGTYFLPTDRAAIMNSIVWPGKLLGTIAFEPILERVGYKQTMYICCVFQVIALIIEMTSVNWIQFSIGRIVAYFAVGIIENAVPAYQAELAPSTMRGLLVGSIQVCATGGNLWGAGMSRAFATEPGKRGWLIPVGIQFIPAVLLIVGVPFCVESPRWLIIKNRREEAIANLNRLRPAADVISGLTLAEVDALELSWQESKLVDDGRWIDLFRGSYLKRTACATGLFSYQQSTGGQFVQSYGPTFYRAIGLGALAFTYNIVGFVSSLCFALIGILVIDKTGRRPLFFIGAIFCAFFGFLATGLISHPNPSQTHIKATIASLILVLGFGKLGFSCNAFLVTAELGGVRMRKKIMAAGTAMDVIVAFLVTFTYPYLANRPYGGLGPKVGYIYASVAASGIVWGYFFVPELKGRSLEEVDELYQRGLWGWQFRKYETQGIGRQIAQLEQGVVVSDKGIEVHHEEKAREEGREENANTLA